MNRTPANRRLGAAAGRQRRIEPHVAAGAVCDDVYPQYLGLSTDRRERFAERAQRS